MLLWWSSLVPNSRFDMGLVTGRMSQTPSDWPEDLVKKTFAPPSPLKKLAAKYITCPTMDNNDEWYTWDEIQEEEVID